MIIFDLDTLADCKHRRHFVDPSKNSCFEVDWPHVMQINALTVPKWRHKETGKKWKPDWQAFNEACDKDEPIIPIMSVLRSLWGAHDYSVIEIWTGRCESVRQKTEAWLMKYGVLKGRLKMRPIGDNRPAHELKEQWLDEIMWAYINPVDGKIEPTQEALTRIDFIFDSDPDSIAMWKRRGIFVFNCAQHDEEF